MKKVLIIAEAGVNHNGSLPRAIDMVDAAAEAGADLVKFQTFDTALSISRNAPKAMYQITATGNSDSQYEMVKKLELSHQSHDALISRCAEKNIGFFSTGFDIPSINYLVAKNINLIKIPSGEITNYPLLKHISTLGLPLILSTGMAKMGEIEAALEVLCSGNITTAQITVLHCNTEYPTPYSDVNLTAMLTIGRAFGVDFGYSDHSLGIEVPIAAVAMGATVIEKHFTLDKSLPGPDQAASLEPLELTAMVRSIRNIESAIAGDGIKRPSSSEIKNIAVARKSIVALTEIKFGETLTVENIGVKRPGTGITAMDWPKIIGRRAVRDFSPDEVLEI